MGKVTGFLEYKRQPEEHEPARLRVLHYHEFTKRLSDEAMSIQGARCMDCGIPFCMNGCPVGNIIPDWNDLVFKGDWKQALDVLHSTNNFPEFTGRVCPAPCEAACTLQINDDAVGIKSIEHAIIDKGFELGLVAPKPATQKTGKRVAVIGSGPSGLACAQQLGRAGYAVVVFEKNDRIGGLLRYGIPDFKLEKHHIDRRVEQMTAEGVEFRVNQHVGVNVGAKELAASFDAVVLAGGSEQPRELAVPGRDLEGIYPAIQFLTLQNRRVAGDKDVDPLSAEGKHVVVIGGGDTGSDCVGTSNRQGALSVTQLELLPRPPAEEDKPLVWPYWPMKFRVSSSHEEGAERDFAVMTKAFRGESGRVQSLVGARMRFRSEGGFTRMAEVLGSEFEIPADLVLLAMGYLHPVHEGLLADLGVNYDNKGNVRATTEGPGSYQTTVPKVFVAGDMRRGQSLVVWAIREGRQAARAVDEFLRGFSDLPR